MPKVTCKLCKQWLYMQIGACPRSVVCLSQQGPKVGKNTHGAIAPSEEADSDASAGTDFEESLAFVPGASSVKYYAPMPSAIAQTKPGAAGNGWRWSRRPAT